MTLVWWWKGFALGVTVWTALRCLRGLSAAERFQVWTLYLCVLPVMLIPMYVPVVIAPPIVVNAAVVKAVQGTASLPVYWMVAGLLAGWSVWKLLAAFGIWRRAKGDNRIRYSDELSGPAAVGLLRPAILLPFEAREWPSERLEQVLGQERAHCERKDVLLDFLGTLAVACFWVQPFAWLALREMRREREWAADDRVLLEGLDRIEYAQTLYQLTAESSLQPAMAGNGRGSMEERMIHLLDKSAPRRAASGLFALLAIVALAAMTFLIPKVAMGQESAAKKFDVAPKVIEKIEPQYTVFARESHIQGTVVLSLVVSREGYAKDIRIVRSLDDGLDEKAVEAILQWRFQPAEKDGKAIDAQATIEVNFRLE